jgi:hypothetical protein
MEPFVNMRHCPCNIAGHPAHLSNCQGCPGAGAAYNALQRFRLAMIGLLAVSTALHMWGANVALNLAGEQKDALQCPGTV